MDKKRFYRVWNFGRDSLEEVRKSVGPPVFPENGWTEVVRAEPERERGGLSGQSDDCGAEGVQGDDRGPGHGGTPNGS